MNRHEKAKATKLANAEQFASQTITIDSEWQILRFDDMNWEVQFKGKFWGYFSSLPAAFKALPAKMIDQNASGSIADVLRCVEGIAETIQAAVNRADFSKP
jgi:hypothetical protein